MNFSDFVKHIRYNILDPDFNDLAIDFCDKEIRFKLYDMGDVIIVYNGDVDDIKVYMYEDDPEVLELNGVPMSEIKDIYGIMEAIKDNSDMLDSFLNKDQEVINYVL